MATAAETMTSLLNEDMTSPTNRSENESPTFDGAYGFGGRVGLLSPSGGVVGGDGMSASGRSNRQGTPNEISAPYEVPQFPIEEIERKLAIQRQLSLRFQDLASLPGATGQVAADHVDAVGSNVLHPEEFVQQFQRVTITGEDTSGVSITRHLLLNIL